MRSTLLAFVLFFALCGAQTAAAHQPSVYTLKVPTSSVSYADQYYYASRDGIPLSKMALQKARGLVTFCETHKFPEIREINTDLMQTCILGGLTKNVLVFHVFEIHAP